MPRDIPLTDAERTLHAVGALRIEGDVYFRLFSYYLNSGEMPYGVAKVQHGHPDPYDWIEQRLNRDLAN